jgi:hypothetical protein
MVGAAPRPRYHVRVAGSYADAVAALYQAPLEGFVAERKRLAGELKGAGDTAGAARLAKLARPPISAWAVNLLWWQARELFESLLASAERIREGNLGASREHRDALGKLRARAAELLAGAGHAAPDATLRRITTTLSTLAAGGGFDPDPPGALSADRDPAGFAAVAFSAAPSHAPRDSEPAQAVPQARGAAERERAAQAAAEREREAQAAAERERRAAEQRLEGERRAAQAALASAEANFERCSAEVARLEQALNTARDALRQARSLAAEAKQHFTALEKRKV